MHRKDLQSSVSKACHMRSLADFCMPSSRCRSLSGHPGPDSDKAEEKEVFVYLDHATLIYKVMSDSA